MADIQGKHKVSNKKYLSIIDKFLIQKTIGDISQFFIVTHNMSQWGSDLEEKLNSDISNKLEKLDKFADSYLVDGDTPFKEYFMKELDGCINNMLQNNSICEQDYSLYSRIRQDIAKRFNGFSSNKQDILYF
jgi:hypothetical protein